MPIIANTNDRPDHVAAKNTVRVCLGEPDSAGDWTLRSWDVSYRSGAGWYPVGEFVALDAAGAIERAVEVFGPGSEYQAEEIPWDAAPLHRVKPPAPRAED
jgi:hypothetical protein